MYTVIFGSSDCSYSRLAIELAEALAGSQQRCNFRFIDIGKEKLDLSQLSDMAGKPLTTLPQIFVDETHIGGFTDFEQYSKRLS